MGLRNRVGEAFPLLARQASVSLLTYFIWMPVRIKNRPLPTSVSKGRSFHHAVPPSFSLTGPVRPYPITGINRGSLLFFFPFQPPGSKATFRMPSFKWSFSRRTILSFKWLCVLLFFITFFRINAYG